MAKRENEVIPVGYSALLQLFAIEALPHYRTSYILAHGTPFSERNNHEESHYYRRAYFSQDLQNPINHLEFALKYDGLNLEILLGVFKKIEPAAIEKYILSQPTSKLARKIWFLYEFLSENRLKISDALHGSYVLLLDPKEYYTGSVIRSRRHRVSNNLLGNRLFCPIVRRVPSLAQYEAKNFSANANRILEQTDPNIIRRAVNYLYVKETMSSYEIEMEKPDSARAQRFIQALQRADHLGPLTKEILIELQNIIVDPRYANNDYRNFQNYIATELRLDVHHSLIDYISPKPDDVPGMMQGLLESLERMLNNGTHPVIAAAAISFGFVLIHPFEDGNGRLHRFIIHYIFARSAFVPKGAIFPISAVILKERASYDALFESFSKPLLNLIRHYELNNKGELSLRDDTASHYRYIDYTQFASFLFECIEKTINTDFKKEIDYLIHYDKTKKALQNVIDIPDNKMNLFIQLVLQNRGSLSIKKRESHFSMLTDEEVHRMEAIIRENMLESNH